MKLTVGKVFKCYYWKITKILYVCEQVVSVEQNVQIQVLLSINVNNIQLDNIKWENSYRLKDMLREGWTTII